MNYIFARTNVCIMFDTDCYSLWHILGARLNHRTYERAAYRHPVIVAVMRKYFSPVADLSAVETFSS